MWIWTSPTLSEPKGRQIESTWRALARRFTYPRAAPTKEGLSRWAPVLFRNGYRCRINVRACFACVLDVDKGGPQLGEILAPFEGLHVLAHSTWSSTKETPRWRIVVPLDRPVSADAYERVWRWLAMALEDEGIEPDYQGSAACQPWAVPGQPPSGFYASRIVWGNAASVADALKAIPPPEAPAPVKPTPRGQTYDAVVERARRYLAMMPPAISGSGGSNQTFLAAQVLVRGFSLDPDDSLALLAEYNERCQPPWPLTDLKHKIKQAIHRGKMAPGKFLDTTYRRSS